MPWKNEQKKWTVTTLSQLLLNIWIKPCASYQKESNGEVIEWKKAWWPENQLSSALGVQYYGHHQFNFNYVKLVGLKLMPSSTLFIALNLQPLVVVAYLVHTSLHTTSESDWLKNQKTHAFSFAADFITIIGMSDLVVGYFSTNLLSMGIWCHKQNWKRLMSSKHHLASYIHIHTYSLTGSKR